MLYQGVATFTSDEPLVLSAGEWGKEEWSIICRALNIPAPGFTKQIVCENAKFSVLCSDDGDPTQVVTINCPICRHKAFVQWDIENLGQIVHCPKCGTKLNLIG